MSNDSGIKSLAGFSYQIRVFAYYLSKLKPDMQIEFETIDDVNIKTVNKDNIDDYSEDFISKFKGNSNTAIQVKHTKISESVARKILYNWMIIENDSYKNKECISKYILFTDINYENSDMVFNISEMTYLK